MPDRVSKLLLLLLLGTAIGAFADDGNDPFHPSVTLESLGPEEGRMTVFFPVPEGHSLYADMVAIGVQDDAVALTPLDIPVGEKKPDPFSIPPEEREMYLRDTVLTYRVRLEPGRRFELTVSYQGCTESLCFLPVTRNFVIEPPDPSEEIRRFYSQDEASSPPSQETATIPPETMVSTTPAAPGAWQEQIGGFSIAGTEAGFLGPESFIAFLDRAESGTANTPRGWAARIENAGLLILIALTLAGGLLLNLTPCVLPMIPINLAVIGAGVRAGSRARGFGLGGAYGAGIALTYGLLGIAVAAGGAKFGTLNSEPWFNLTIAIIFAILALAMFGVFHLDFSRFRVAGSPRKPTGGNYLLAGFMGMIAAFLAGACVAPVVVAVLLFARNLYAAGHPSALLLPLLLGVGMALPWPFAGAGLSFLPKPGKWMTWVKNGFGVFILAMAVYYGHLGLSLHGQRASGETAAEVAASQHRQSEEGDWLNSLEEALRVSKEQNQRIFVDFWATWCKNCLAMERTTFRNPAVQKRLESFIKVKVQLEDFRDPEVQEIQKYFDIIGLPSYAVLEPSTAETGKTGR